MKKRVKTLGKTRLPYYTKGDSPTLLIHSGTHGDEYGVIESVRRAVEKYEERLPDFIYVPEVSPSAVASRTRVTESGLDLNRSCFENCRVAEIEANFTIVTDKKFDLMVTFHEDPHWDSTFYLYDINAGIGEGGAWKNYKGEIEALGLNLLNGADDPDDPVLNFVFNDGYHYFVGAVEGYEGGSFDAWAIRNGVIRKALVPEIPGKLAQKKKDQVVDLFFSHFLLVT